MYPDDEKWTVVIFRILFFMFVRVKLILLSEMAIQIDGEAWMKQPSEITIYHQNQAKLLLNQKKDKKGAFAKLFQVVYLLGRVEQRLTNGT